MKRIVLLILITTMTLLLLERINQTKNEFIQIATTQGTKDNPLGRADWELNRLKDPNTNIIPANIRTKELKYVETLPFKPKRGVLDKNNGANKIEAEVSWTSVGPYNVGGRTRALEYDVDDESIIMAGGVSGGLWRSTNGGTDWAKVTVTSNLHSITCIAQDLNSFQNSTWYYGTGEYTGNSADGRGGAYYTGDGIFKSIDYGVSWTLLGATSTGSPQTFDNFFDYVWNLKVNSQNGDLYAATYGAIFKSTNGGTLFTKVLGDGSPYANTTDIAITNTGIMYASLSSQASTTKGIYRSTDGDSWTNISSGVTGFPSTYGRIVMEIAASNENILYFLIYESGSDAGSCGLFKYTYSSGDGSGTGGTWVDRSSNLPSEGSLTGDFESQGGYDLVVKVKPDNSDFVIVGGTSLFKSTDGFASSGNTTRIGGYATKDSYAGYTNHHADQHSLFFFDSDKKIVVSGHDGGLSKTTDITASSVSWTSLNNGYLTSQFYNIALNRGVDGNEVIIGGLQDNGTYSNEGNTSTTHTWVRILSGDGAHCEILDDHSHVVSAQNGTTYHQNANATNWTRIDPTGGSGYLFINPFALNPNDTKMLFLAAGKYLWRNSDVTGISRYSNSTTSTNWTQLTSTNTDDATDKQISAIGVSTTNNTNVVYYGTENGEVYRVDDANTGATPTRTDIFTGKGFPTTAYVSCIAVDPTESDNVMVVFSNYSVKSVFYSLDAGSNWADVSGNLEENSDGSGSGPSVRWVVIAPGTGDNYFVGTSTGVYSTATLNGTSTSWALDGASSIGNVVVDCIDYRRIDGRIIVGTHANGIFKGTINSPVPVEITSFTSNQINNNIILNWTTATEINNYGFEIERTFPQEAGLSPQSLNGVEGWETLGFVEGHGNSNSPKEYSFIDASVAERSRSYRLKQIDTDGSFEYSDEIEIMFNKSYKYSMEQNHPNPFNPTTMINYSIMDDSKVVVEVYNTLGQKVVDLFSGTQTTGKHSVTWNATGFSSGTYFARFTATSLQNNETYTKVKKLLLIK